jgi:ATP-dependent Clp protease ATP-binding subunit ClpC
MFERYTERARRTIFWARFIADQVGSPEIEPIHLLLGLLRVDMTLAQRFFGSPWALEVVWRRVAKDYPDRERGSGPRDLPLSKAGKRVVASTAEEANRLSSRSIGTSHILLSLLREKKCLVAQMLRDQGIRLKSVREELARFPYDDSVLSEFVREREPPPEDIREVQSRIRSLRNKASAAAAEHDLAKAESYSAEERSERDRLYLLCQRHGRSDWLYE